MKYDSFKNDFNNLLTYNNHQFCFDQVLYAFNDKYNSLTNEIWIHYIKNYYNEYPNNDWFSCMEQAITNKNLGFKIYMKDLL